MPTSSGQAGSGRRFAVGPILPLIPFFVFAFVFLIVPTATVIAGAFQGDAGFDPGNLKSTTTIAAFRALRGSILVSFVSAFVGAVVGAIICYRASLASRTSLFRRAVVAVSGVLAQFGGVTLAFAFISAYSAQGVITLYLKEHAGLDIYGNAWLLHLTGLNLVYVFFQVPLMIIVFLPAMEGLRPQWREAAVNLGATPRQYWLQVGFPLLTPAFLGSLLLLFANAFAAYATAAALITQSSPILPLLIRAAISSETLPGQGHVGFALALEMIVVVVLVMTAYALLVRRTSRWLK